MDLAGVAEGIANDLNTRDIDARHHFLWDE
jgi:hypothetical protein